MTQIARSDRAIRTFEPRRAALPEMATAVLILDEDRLVEYVNASAETLFDPVDPIGCALPALFASCNAVGGDRIFNAVDAGAAPAAVRIRLNDDRLLDGTVRSLSGGGYVLSMDDVTFYVHQAELAKHDALTGLANRAALRSQLVERLADDAQAGRLTAVLYVDLDRFKAVNDTLGHPAGDALLRKVANRFRKAACEKDFVARIGGDEFAVIQSDASQPAAAIALAARIVDLIGRTYAIDGQTLNIGASVGIAVAPCDGHDPDILLKNADLALYRAKAEGRSCYRFFEPGMDRRMQDRRLLEIDLRRALAFKELTVAYQPQYNLTTDKIMGFEALARWHHPIRGEVFPEEFIPLAEEIGVIMPIGEWVLRTACADAVSWPLPLSVSVNISPVQFRSGKILSTVLAALAYTGLPANRLELEITERVMSDDTDEIRKVLAALAEVGVAIALDDFGVGYSSLSYLTKYPFSKIKIDQSYVRGINTHPDRRAIFSTVVNLATILEMQTVAEGVESDAELACVRAEGCGLVQGFLTGRPVSPKEVIRLLNKRKK